MKFKQYRAGVALLKMLHRLQLVDTAGYWFAFHVMKGKFHKSL